MGDTQVAIYTLSDIINLPTDLHEHWTNLLWLPSLIPKHYLFAVQVQACSMHKIWEVEALEWG